MVRLQTTISPKEMKRMNRYIIQEWGLEESFHGKAAEVTRRAVKEFLDKHLIQGEE